MWQPGKNGNTSFFILFKNARNIRQNNFFPAKLTSHEVVVVEPEERVGGVEELGVEDDLDAVGAIVEQLAAPECVHHRVHSIVLGNIRKADYFSFAVHSKQRVLKLGRHT